MSFFSRSAAPACGAAGVAFEAGAVADEGEVAAFAAAVAFVAFHAGFLDLLEAGVGPPFRRDDGDTGGLDRQRPGEERHVVAAGQAACFGPAAAAAVAPSR